MENWDEVWRRNQFLCSGLAEHFPDSKILFVDLPRDISYALRSGKWNKILNPAQNVVPCHSNIIIMQPLKLLPNTISWGRRFNEWHFRRQVNRAARELSLNHPILWLNPHSAVHMVGHMGEGASIYDITDDWISLTQSERLRELTIKQDRDLCYSADTVIVCSEKLYDMKQGMARSLHLVPNGVDVAHYQTLELNRPLSDETMRWAHPVFGYTGTIHPDRVDIGLILSLARAYPEGTVTLVGPDMLSPSVRAALLSTGNIRITGAVAYADVPRYMRAFDVCITPHLVTPFTESLNPIKLWEYLAFGKPIVSTDVAGFRNYPNLVRIAHDHEAFIESCHEALLEGDTLCQARRAVAAQNTWDARLDQVIEILKPFYCNKE